MTVLETNFRSLTLSLFPIFQNFQKEYICAIHGLATWLENKNRAENLSFSQRQNITESTTDRYNTQTATLRNGREKERIQTYSSLILLSVMFFHSVSIKNSLASLRESLEEYQKTSLCNLRQSLSNPDLKEEKLRQQKFVAFSFQNVIVKNLLQ